MKKINNKQKLILTGAVLWIILIPILAYLSYNDSSVDRLNYTIAASLLAYGLSGIGLTFPILILWNEYEGSPKKRVDYYWYGTDLLTWKKFCEETFRDTGHYPDPAYADKYWKASRQEIRRYKLKNFVNQIIWKIKK